ncbi:UDP-N-acetylmuramate:L-alanyl-gamma-D-glutamyl-meso-diaminopimelate ligase [Shigella sonnei]|nr:UDP-N-acetylmuramate:L-alanyl-gamma-D-glutamyl-meso-diaminopimelate ligase [Shigella sonnei]
MRIHILGICGTFMGGLAMLARQLGHEVTGSDANVYPPMSTLLEKQGIELIQGYDASQLEPQPDLVIIGNAMTRGNPCVEAVLEKNIPYMSGPQWLHDFAARPLGAGRCRYTRQNHHRGNGDLDSGTVWLQTGICDRRCAGEL